MSERVYLSGSEDVQRAASQMQSAAEVMSRAAANMSGALERHEWFLNDWLSRLEQALAARRALEQSDA